MNERAKIPTGMCLTASCLSNLGWFILMLPFAVLLLFAFLLFALIDARRNGEEDDGSEDSGEGDNGDPCATFSNGDSAVAKNGDSK